MNRPIEDIVYNASIWKYLPRNVDLRAYVVALATLLAISVVMFYSNYKYPYWHIVLGIVFLAIVYYQISDIQLQRKFLLIGCFAIRAVICMGILFGCAVRFFYVNSFDVVPFFLMGITWIPSLELLRYFQDKTVYLFLIRLLATSLIIISWCGII